MQSISPPSLLWAEWFDALPPEDQRRRLGIVQKRWVDDQSEHFRKYRDWHERKARTLRQIGLVLAVTGWVAAACLLLPSGGCGVRQSGPAPTAGRYPSAPLLVISGLLVLGGGLVLAYQERESHEHLARLYDRMAGVFVQGRVELKRHFAASPPDLAAAQHVIRQMGAEAVTEQAQWLVLRRSRPFELPLA